MSAISSSASRRAVGAAGIVRPAGTALTRCWVGYINWRIELLAAARSSFKGGPKPPDRGGPPPLRLADGVEDRAFGHRR